MKVSGLSTQFIQTSHDFFDSVSNLFSKISEITEKTFQHLKNWTTKTSISIKEFCYPLLHPINHKLYQLQLILADIYCEIRKAFEDEIKKLRVELEEKDQKLEEKNQKIEELTANLIRLENVVEQVKLDYRLSAQITSNHTSSMNSGQAVDASRWVFN